MYANMKILDVKQHMTWERQAKKFQVINKKFDFEKIYFKKMQNACSTICKVCKINISGLRFA